MSKHDGKQWWRQPAWRKVFFFVGFALMSAGLVWWRIQKRKAIEAGVRDSDMVGPPPGVWTPDKSSEVHAWEVAKHEAAVAAATDRILDETAAQTIASFRKNFGRG